MFRWLIMCCLIMVSLPILAQETDVPLYDNALFSFPAPEGWTDASTGDMAHFISPDGAVNLYAFALFSGDSQALPVQIIPDFVGTPVQSNPVPLGVLTWTQDVYILDSGELLAMIYYADETGVIYVLGVKGLQTALGGVTPMLNEVLLNFVIKSIDTSVPSAPYDDPSAYTEQEVMVITGRWELGGTLLTPVGEELFPAVVIVHGSGPSDRDGTVSGVNKPYRDLAQGLASNGVAVLRYDKRTLVYRADSADDVVNLTVDDETINDALSAIALLRNMPNIDPNRIYVVGHSMGGMLAPEIAQRDNQLAGIIILAGNSRSLVDVALEQMDYLQPLPINSSDEAQSVINQMRADLQAINQLTPDSDPNQLLFGAYTPYWLDMLVYDQIATAQNLEIPLLILQGERDYQVTMQDFELWQSSLADKADVTFISYPALNHLFLAGEGVSTPVEYAIQSHIPEEVISDIVNWIVG
ncbi:MAG: alpha/beta fold hydrolase [Phototrophicales bacterium]|nr:alpha/beta fold hydrolase [Phototrophicales bacterium]